VLKTESETAKHNNSTVRESAQQKRTRYKYMEIPITPATCSLLCVCVCVDAEGV